jgi:polyhydroxybutyrate depolymerase
LHTPPLGIDARRPRWCSGLAALLGVCLLAACAEPVEASALSGESGMFRLSFEHDAVQREAIVYVPTSYAVGEGTALVMNFHGFGGTGETHLQWTDMRELAERDGAIVVYPTGTESEGSTHWNCSLPSEDNKSTADDFGFVEVLIGTIAASYDLDEDRVYAVGYSNGGMMAFGLACFRSDLVAAVGAVSGAMLDDAAAGCETTHPTSIITLHGTADSVLSYEGGGGAIPAEDVIDLWVGLNQTDPEPVTGEDTSGGATIQHLAHEGGTGGAAVHHYRYLDGDHVWFEDSYQGADASSLVWDFLNRFDRDGAL